jgi:acetolactate synthase I/II/III large subunit
VSIATETEPVLQPVYKGIVDALAAFPTHATFGLMGEDTADLITDLDRVEIPYYAAMHENVAVSMAVGYAWSSGGLGIAILSRGPGLTNASSALATAAARGSRLLIITGEARRGTAPGADAKAFIPQAQLAAALGLEFRTVAEPDEVLPALYEAAASAMTGRPTILAVPVDLLGSQTPAQEPVALEPVAPGAPGQAVPSEAELQNVVQILAASTRPLILAGRGAVDAGAREQLIALAERTGALLGTTLMARDLFRGHRYDLGLVGGCTSERGRRLLDDIDCVLVFGASLSVFTTARGSLFPDVPIVQFDVDPSSLTERFLPIRQAILSDARVGAERLLETLGTATTAAEHPLHSAEVLDSLPDLTALDEDASTADAIDPRVLTAAIDRLLPADRTVLSDGGHSTGFPMMHLRLPDPDHYFLAVVGIGSIGMGLGAAMGVAIGRPETQTVLFVGDGTVSMTLGDLATASRYSVPLVIVVLNDQAYGAERHFLDLHSLPNHHSIFPDLDFAGVGNDLGIESATIRSVADLQAQAAALSSQRDKPLLLDCKIRPDLRSAWIEEIA